MFQSRRIDWPVVHKLGRFAVATGAAWLVASFALLVLIGSSSGAAAATATPAATSTAAATATTAAPAQAAPTSRCFPLTESGGTCYNAGEFCPNADLNMSGVAENGTPIACEPDGGQQPHWEACTPVSFTATPASTAAAEPSCPVAQAGSTTPTGTPTGASTSATPGATTGAPAGAPATGGGTGPGTSVTLAAAGCAIMLVGAGLVFFSRRRSRRRPA